MITQVISMDPRWPATAAVRADPAPQPVPPCASGLLSTSACARASSPV